MARRFRQQAKPQSQSKAIQAKAAPAIPVLTITPPVLPPSALLSHPDSHNDALSHFGFGSNPLTTYRQEPDFFVRRQMIYDFASRSTATSAMHESVSDEIAAQEIYVTPTETNPSASTLMIAEHGVNLINNSMNKPDGILDWIKVFVESYWFSKTGVFILTPRDSTGQITSIGILNPMQPFPHYGWQDSYYNNGNKVPMVKPPTDTMGNPIYEVQGIWYVDGGLHSSNYFALPPESYHQIAPGAYGWGAFLDTRPRAEKMLPKILTHIHLVEYLLDTVLCTDDAQAILWQNVNPDILETYAERRRIIREKRRNGEKINPEDEGRRLHVTALEPDKSVDAKVVNFHAFPADFDIMGAISQLEMGLALGFGVNPRRIAPEAQRERFGNAQQAAMLNSDEPGVRAVKQSITQYYSSVIFGGQPLRASFMAMNSPENYALIAKDVQIAQALSQAAPFLSVEEGKQYMVRNGFLLPAEVGLPSVRTGDGSTKSTAKLARRFAKLCWSDGTPVIYEKPIVINTPMRHKAADTFDVEECALEAQARYEEWIKNELPTVIDPRTGVGINRRDLEQEVNGIGDDLWAAMVLCAKKNIGNIHGDIPNQMMQAIRYGWLNAMMVPTAANGIKPQNNLFKNLWALQGRIAMGKATVEDLQQAAAFFTSYIDRYFNGFRCIYNYRQHENDTGPVNWIRHALESCGDCVRFEGTYPNMATLMQRTGGLLPGDIRLTCAGHCKCELQGDTTNG